MYTHCLYFIVTFDDQVDNSNDGVSLVEAEAAVPSVAVVASDHGGGGVVSHNLGGTDLDIGRGMSVIL